MGKKVNLLFASKKEKRSAHRHDSQMKKEKLRQKEEKKKGHGMQEGKKYKLSTASNKISKINIDQDGVDDILRLLLQLEMCDGEFESVDDCVASIMGEEKSSKSLKVKESEQSSSESDDSDSDSDSDDDCDNDFDNSDDDDDGDDDDEDQEDVNISSRVISNNKADSEAFDCVEEAVEKRENIVQGECGISEINGEFAGKNEAFSMNAILSVVDECFYISNSLRSKILKKLVRDDRRIANELKAEQYAAKQEKKALKREQFKKQQHNSCEGSLAPPPQDVKLRLQICSEKKKSSTKVMTIDRHKGWKVSELVDNVRRKLNEPKKYNSLIILPSKETFEDGDICFFENDTQLCLVAGHHQKPVEAKKSIAPTNKKESDPSEKFQKATAENQQHVGDDTSCRALNEVSFTHISSLNDVDVSSPLCNDAALSARLKQERGTMLSLNSYQSILDERSLLPMYKARELFLQELKASRNNTVVVVGDTGCGKTTQIPQIILDDMVDNNKGSETFIICTQPRRIAAITIAERVAQERLQKCGDWVGYQIRLKSNFSRHSTRILFCTTGVLLRKIQDNQFLGKVSHIIIDEVHERQVETDFLMAILRREMPFRPNLHLVLMSATLNSESLKTYMNNCPVVEVPGRLFPVTVHYMDEVNSIIGTHSNNAIVKNDIISGYRPNQEIKGRKKGGKLSGKKSGMKNEVPQLNASPPKFNAEVLSEFIIRLIEKEQSNASNDVMCNKTVLVFLSGIQAITSVMNKLLKRQVANTLKAKVFVLHSSVPAAKQRLVFSKLPSDMKWKIVLSTNIAESSVTVNDVLHVIDSGFHREMTFDPISGMSLLSTVVASKASMTQRCGRAGRVRPGDCWRMFDQGFMESPRLKEFSLPEIRRVPLEDVVLHILILQLGDPQQFLSQCIDPPSCDQVNEALRVLTDIGAIVSEKRDSDGCDADVLFRPYQYYVTPLGRHLANLPLDVRLGKMLIYASIFGCLEPALTIAATLSGKSPMVAPLCKREEANRAHADLCKKWMDGMEHSALPMSCTPFSDHIAFVQLFEMFAEVDASSKVVRDQGKEVREFCAKHYLDPKILNEISALREQYRKYLIKAGIVITNDSKMTADDVPEDDSDSDVDVINVHHDGKGNKFSKSDAILRCVICAGLFPRVARVCRVQSLSSAQRNSRQKNSVQRMFDSSGNTVDVHPSSVLSRHKNTLLGTELNIYKAENEKKKEAFVVFYKMISSPDPQMYDCTEVSPVSLMLFGESFSELTKSKRSKVVVNKWIHLNVSEVDAALIRKLRFEIESILLAKAEGCDTKNALKIQSKQFLVTSILEKLLLQHY